MNTSQVGGEFADGPAGEGLAELGGAGGGRLDDEVLVARTEQAGTASRPARGQAGQADLVEPVDHVADGVLVGLHQLGDHRDPVPAGRGPQHHRAPVAHRAGDAPAHDYESEPKTEGSSDTIALADTNIAVLREHKARQDKQREEWSTARQDTGKVFTQEDGSWLHPGSASETFRRLLGTTDLPPIKLRDLRHVAATLTHGGGGDIHAVKETLRHSTIALTSDTYTSLLPEVDREIAEKAANLIPRCWHRSLT